MLGDGDTIAAIATAKGMGALGIVRLSGPATDSIVRLCFRSKTYDNTKSHKAHFGVWENPKSASPVDEVVLLNFAEGRGFTGEAAVEIICHGGVQVTNLVLEAALSAGARQARPGEFTYRAVMNNKLDLARAESLLDLIRAKTPRAAAQALHNIRGALSEKLGTIEKEVVWLLAHLEASIDFTTEDIQPVSFSEMLFRTRQCSERVGELLNSFVAGQVIRQGLKVAIAGRPNAGKSSILNKLVGYARSIVTDTPGTTRDTIEEEVLIDGTLFKFVDTAGLRQGESDVERQGIARTIDELKVADVILYLVDLTQGLSNEDVETIRPLDAGSVMICFNKSDLLTSITQAQINHELQRFGLKEYTGVSCSSFTDDGVSGLKKELVSFAEGVCEGEMDSVISTHRQREGLSAALEALKMAEKHLEQEASPEFIAFELKEALLKVQEVLGKSPGEEIMNQVFKEFCIGK